MNAVLVKNDDDDYDLTEIELDEQYPYVTFKGRVYEYVGTQDGKLFYSDL